MLILNDFAARNVLGVYMPTSKPTFDELSYSIVGVRGNHDQKIIEWRSWFNWVRTFPEGERWLATYVDESVHAVQNGTSLEPLSLSPNKRFPIPEGWEWASQHWQIARLMTEAQFEYLVSLPLVLHLPSLHTMIVHAGLLPVDPTEPLNSKDQPLSRVPKSSKYSDLRTAQEVAVVTKM